MPKTNRRSLRKCSNYRRNYAVKRKYFNFLNDGPTSKAENNTNTKEEITENKKDSDVCVCGKVKWDESDKCIKCPYKRKGK